MSQNFFMVLFFIIIPATIALVAAHLFGLLLGIIAGLVSCPILLVLFVELAAFADYLHRVLRGKH